MDIPTNVLIMFIVLIIVSSFWIVIGIRKLKKYKELQYNLRQSSIFWRTTDLLLAKARDADIPREDLVIALNAAVDTLNESLRGDCEHLKMQRFPMVRNSDEQNQRGKNEETE